ncbi:alpha/beta hydrolase [Aeromicrobium terrae]|uniref:alpha/beta hydrolase n=1 Tax=Aeromicrobium terrae TaxID=2498846 RepID=UPI00164F2C45|nr:alpha/beta fold hydrolase [Aeromicrobium terrae]
MAPGVLLVHGAWHGAWCWNDGFAQRLEDRGIPAKAIDLRGHGEQNDGRRLNRHRMRHYADDVVTALRETDGPTVLVGHSMGGGVVQQVLARRDRPALGGAALLASMPPAGVWRITLKIARQHPLRFLAANATLDLGRLATTPDRARELFLSADAPDALAESTASRVHSESYLAFLDMLLLDRPRPRPIDEPVLIVGAERDEIFTPKEVAATARAWGTEPVMVDTAHDVMLDAGWERVADLLADWVLALASVDREM